MILRLAAVFLIGASALHARSSLALAGMSLGSAVGATYYWNRNDIITASTDFNKAYNWTANANATGARPASSDDDDFTNNTLDAAWTFRDYDNAAGGAASLTTNADQLTLTGQGTKLWDVVNHFVAVQRSDITGSFDVSVKVTSVASFSASEGKAGFIMADDITTPGSGGFLILAVKSNGTVNFEYDVAGAVGTNDGFAASGTNSFPIWLRLVKNGTAASAFYRTAVSNAWTQVGTAQTPQSADANSHIGIFMVSGTPGTTGTAVFDDFQGGTDMSATDNALSFAGTGGGTYGPDANATLSAAQEAASINFTGYTGTFNLGSYALTLNTGNATLVSGMSLTAGSGTLDFTAPSGTQVFTPKPSATHPHISHTGAGTLQLSTNDLTCLSFTQSAGILDFNSVDVTTSSSGNFTVTNGTSSTLANLNGRTLTVAGAASFAGQSTSLLNLNTASWTINATGSLTASYATLSNCNASGGSAGSATNSTNGGSNLNWTFDAQPTGYAYSMRIGFNTTSTGADVSSNVTNFPLLVRLNSNNFIFSQAHVSGDDIRFADPDGTSLSYHIERWDATNKVAEVWVKVPQVDGNSKLDYVTMYWGNPTVAAASSGSGVFSNYKAVWHLNQSPAAGANGFVDASGNSNHGTAQSGAAGDSLTSAIGLGFKLNGSSKWVSSAVSYANPTTFTIGGWFKTATASGGGILAFTNSQTGVGASRDRAVWMDNTGKLSFATYPGSANVITSTSAYNDGRWHHVAGRISAAGTYLFVDGISVASNGTTGSQNYTGWWRGSYFDASSWTPTSTSPYLNGTLDELWVTHSELSADYIKLSYETQKPGTTVLAYPNTSLSDWSYSTKVYVNTAATGARTTSDLSDFPLLVRLTAANFNFSQAYSDGRDLRFADSAGNLLAYEIERFDATNKLAEIWVLLPTVYGNSNSQWFKMYWGKATATSLSSSTSVFDSDNDFIVNYHMSGASGSMADATPYGNNGTGNGNIPNQVDGNIGKAQDFDGNGDWFSGGSSSSMDVSANDKVTLSAWVRRDGAGVTGHEEGILGKFEWNTGNYRSYALFYNSGTGLKFNLSSNGTAESSLNPSGTGLTNGTWYHVAAVSDNATMKMYLNGVLVGSQSYSSGIFGTTSADFKVGQLDDDNTYRQYWNGVIDEPSASKTDRSADWIKLCYETQKSGSTVVSLGSRPGDFSYNLRLNFNTTAATGVGVSGNVTNIPILVRLSSSNFTFSATRDDGADIRFVDKDGTVLYHDVAEWDKANKTAKVWVKVPQVDGNSSADFISLYYGCSSCSGNPYAVSDSVWSNHAAAFHLAAPETQALDAGKNDYHGTYLRNQAFMTGITSSLAPIFDGANDYVQTAVPTTAGTRTFSAWIYPRSSDNVTYIESVIDGDVSGQFGTGFGLDNGVFKVILDNEFWTTSKAVTLNAWQHVVLKFNATNAVLYHNGVSAATLTYTRGSISSATLRLGRSMVNAEYFDGAIQEVQVMDSYASDDYVKLSYENQKEGSLLFSSAGITTASFTSSKVFKFNTTPSGANVSGDVYDFPLLLRFTDATLIDATQSAGEDIRFLDGDGVTWLDYQIERWDQGNNVGEIWVKVPKVDGNSAGDQITMYYNDVTNNSVPDGQCASCVFAPSTGFAGVWHLNEDGNNTASGYADATGNGYHGTGGNRENTDDVTGIIGVGQDFDGVDEYIGMSASAGSTASHTVSFWMKPDVQNINMSVVDKLPNDATGVGWNFKLRSDRQVWYRSGSETGATDAQETGTLYSSATWMHVTGTFDGPGDAMKLYLNGTLVESATSTRSVANATTALRLGDPSAAQTTEEFDGTLDELQISDMVRDANWIKLSYESQKASPSLFNPTPADFSSSVKYRFNTTRTGANVMGDVENFPLLLRLTGSTIVDAVQDDWDDIRFLDGDGKTWLNYQVERWSKASDVAEIWVLVPKVDGNSDQDFFTLYYNDVTNAAVPNGQCATCVFGSATSFKAAWHLNAAFTDETGTYNGSDVGSTDVAGISARGRAFNGSSQYVSMGDLDFHNQTAYSATAWVSGAVQTDRRAISESHSVDTDPVWALETDVDGGDGKLDVFIRRDDATSDLFHVQSTSNAFDATWHQIGFTDSAGSWRMYVDGSLENSGSYTKVAKSFDKFTLGALHRSTVGSYWAGSMDEVHLSSTNRSTDWIKLAYETQRPTGSLFWNTRAGPNNKAVLAATPGSSGVSLTWSSAVTDSANADSIGIWVKYSGKPDSVGATGQTKVAVLPLTDSAYTYPATYPMTYYFALAIRNSSGQWSPFTAASTDTVVQTGSAALTDTIYVDSASTITASGAAGPCTNARNPTSALKELEDAVWCAQASGFAPNDTLVVRVMPGHYSSASDNELAAPSTYPVVVAAFDLNSRPVLASSSHSGFTLQLGNNMTLRRVNVMAATNASAGIQVKDNADSVIISGCRIYNNGNTKLDTGIVIPSSNNEGVGVFNNVVYQPNKYGVYLFSDDRANIIGNTFVGSGAAGTKGIYMNKSAYNAGYITITNNIFYNWVHGIHTTDANNEIGTVSNNLFHLVTSGQEVVGETDAARIIRDPLFYSTSVADRNAFKLLPGSPALDAGTSTINALSSESYQRVSYVDHFGTARPQGSARDIGAYEGSGYTPNPSGEFDTLTNSTSGNTVTVENSKFKLVWDMARGGGITGFYDKTGNPATNLVGTNSLLFDVRLDTYVASTQTSNSIAPSFLERTRARSVVRQRLALSASLDLNVYYTVYPSGHVYIHSEIANLGSGTLDVDVVQYGLKVGAADAVTKSADTSSVISYRSGYGYLNLPTRDVFLSVTSKLDGDSAFSERWNQTGSVAGSLDSVTFQTADLSDLGKNLTRHHGFLLYVGDAALDQRKASALNADAFTPSPVGVSAGGLLHEKSWQDELAGHWPLDEGKGTIAKDISVINTNSTSSLTSTSWVSGKVNGALRFTTSSVAVVNDHAVLEARKGFTVSFWVKPDFSAMGSTAFVLSKGQTTSNGWYFRRNSTANTLRFAVDGAYASSHVLTTGVWHHIAGVVGSSGQVWLYVNGVLDSASTANATATVNTDALRFGEDAAGTAADAFAGDLDDVRIYHRALTVAEIQAFSNRGFATKHGHYHLRADNNNRVVALLNESAAATRVQPAFEIDNWYGTKTPKYVYLNGVRLTSNVDYAVDSVAYAGTTSFGSSLYLQLNKVLTGADQTLFVDDNDSSGYLGEAAKMKALTIAATTSDKIAIQNFSGSTFGSASSGQWALELDLNGWTSPTANRVTDTGFGEFNSWKAAAISPNVAVSAATELTGNDVESGRNLSHMKFDDVGANEMYSAGEGYSGTANLTYTLTDSSATRISLVLSNISLSGEGTATLSKRFTVYPNGRIFSSFVLSSTSIAMDQPRIDFQGRYSSSAVETWAGPTSEATGRYGMMSGDLDFHSFACAMLSIRSAGATTSAPGTYMSNLTSSVLLDDGSSAHSRARIYLATSLFEATDDPITINYAMDISRDFTDSATADSLMKDLQTPAVITGITGDATQTDALDFRRKNDNSADSSDNFAEGDGAYHYTASNGIAHFKFVNTVTHFSPAFRIKTWSVTSLPEYVIVDNQTLVRGYHYNAYVNTAADVLLIQFNKNFAPGTHVFYISHKNGLAVSLNRFEAVPGEGVDTLLWTTESEFENLGFHVWRRLSSIQSASASESVGYEELTGTPGVNGRLLAARTLPPPGSASAAKSARASASGKADDTLPRHAYSAEELQALGYVRLTAKLIPGAPGGSSASTREYAFVDRSAAFGNAYEYLLEAVDFQGAREQYGPRTAAPRNPLETALLPNYPNPFNPVTTLRFSLKEQGKVSLLIYDARGRLVRTLIRPDKALAPGRYRMLWNARDEGGFEVPSGQYFYRLATGRYSKTRKMILVK